MIYLSKRNITKSNFILHAATCINEFSLVTARDTHLNLILYPFLCLIPRFHLFAHNFCLFRSPRISFHKTKKKLFWLLQETCSWYHEMNLIVWSRNKNFGFFIGPVFECRRISGATDSDGNVFKIGRSADNTTNIRGKNVLMRDKHPCILFIFEFYVRVWVRVRCLCMLRRLGKWMKK